MSDYWVDVVDGDYAVRDGSYLIQGGFECEADANDFICSLERAEKFDAEHDDEETF